jgi:malonyl-CoA/methylmalonyl-CoA synthetase
LLLTTSGRSYSYQDIDHASARLARFLTELGVRPGDRVSVQVEKSPAALSLYLACLRGGFVFHPLNPRYQPAELEYFLGNATPTVVVCDSNKKDVIRSLANQAGIEHVFTLDGDGTGSLIDESRGVSVEAILARREEDDMAALLYSSGTTGVPKGIMLTHANLLSNTESLLAAWEFNDQDRLLHALPIFHVHGLFVAIGCVLLSGASMRWLDAFDPRAVIQGLPECSAMMGVPTYYTRLLNEADFTADVASNVRVFISGSAPLLQETFVAFEERTGHRILERYGMTETSMNTSNPLHGVRKPGTVGPPLPGVEVRVVDDSGDELPTDDIGNLQVRGPNVFVGYWQMPDKTAEDFTVDGFFNTGDKGLIDEDGYVSIVGRTKDLVITGGLNVYPKEVELFIDDLDGVQESAVIGVPHADFGEAVVAVVVRASEGTMDENIVIKSAKESLANFKVPKRVVFVDELPRNSMAKVQKNILRDTYGRIFLRK